MGSLSGTSSSPPRFWRHLSQDDLTMKAFLNRPHHRVGLASISPPDLPHSRDTFVPSLRGPPRHRASDEPKPSCGVSGGCCGACCEICNQQRLHTTPWGAPFENQERRDCRHRITAEHVAVCTCSGPHIPLQLRWAQQGWTKLCRIALPPPHSIRVVPHFLLQRCPARGLPSQGRSDSCNASRYYDGRV